MTAILGLSAFYHDSAAALVVDGKVIAAVQEERFSREKYDANFPAQAIAYCLGEAGLTPDQLSYIAFYDKPLTKFERLLETYLAYAPAGLRSFSKAMPVWLKRKLYIPRMIRQELDGRRNVPVVFLDHHESHAASAFFPSPFEAAAIMTLDGVGEWSTATFGKGEGNRVELTHHLQFPHSLGLLYSAFTYYCGFKVNSGEYKLMGLAPYGRPRYQKEIYAHLIDLKPDGSFWLNMDYFNYCQGLTMTNERFHRLFGGPPRWTDSTLEQRHMDLASSVQAVTEEIIMRVARTVHRETRMKNLVMAGGVALNCVANGKLLRDGPFENVWIQPAAGDAGGALGAALFVWHQLLQKPRTPVHPDGQQASLLGPRYSDLDIESFLNKIGAVYRRFGNENDLLEHVAQLLTEEKIVGWFRGRAEFGPRALGARSIVGDPRSPRMQATMNLKIKLRESFRPFAPSVSREYVSEWFELADDSPYMLLVADVLPAHRRAMSDAEQNLFGIDKLNVKRSEIPAVTHVDYSARIQTVRHEQNPLYWEIIEAFRRLTGCPVIVNTSFNVRGEPIVCTPEDSYRCFMRTEMDYLVLETCVLDKKEQPAFKDDRDWRKQFALD